MKKKNEVEILYEQVKLVAKDLKVTEETALQLIIAYQLCCVHTHVESLDKKRTKN